MTKDYEQFRALVLRERATTDDSVQAIADRLGVTKGIVSGILWRAGKRRVDAVAPAFEEVAAVAFSAPEPEARRIVPPSKPVQARVAAPRTIVGPPPPPAAPPAPATVSEPARAASEPTPDDPPRKRVFAWAPGPNHVDADAQREMQRRAQAHADKIARGEAKARLLGKKPPTEDELREIVATFERTKGVTVCPPGGQDSLSNNGAGAPVNASRPSVPRVALG